MVRRSASNGKHPFLVEARLNARNDAAKLRLKANLPTQTVSPLTSWADFRQRAFNPPHIDQEAPRGAARRYFGEANCGPTTVAMLLRGLRVPFAGSDASLVEHLARLGKTNQSVGTRPDGMRAMLDSLGLQSEFRRGSGAVWAFEQLQRGRAVIARGDYYSVGADADPAQHEAHYMLLYRREGARVLVHDPGDPELKRLSLAELDTFLAGDAAEGGLQISVRVQR